MKALITGGAGFIGLHLAKHLAEQKYDVTLLDNFARGKPDAELQQVLKKGNVHFLEMDITDANATATIEPIFDQVYHLAAINGTQNFYNIPHKVLKVGFVGTLNMLDWFAEKQKGGGKFLFSSSSEAYAGALKLLGDKFPIPTPEEVPLVVDDPTNVRWSYGVSKIASEVAMHSYAKEFGLENMTIIRYHNIYGPRMGFEHVIPQFVEHIVKKENPFKINGGQETRTFCYVDDAVRATQLVMESPMTKNKTIHIGRDDGEIKIVDLARLLFDMGAYHPSIEINGSPNGSVARRCPNVTKLRGLGFTPYVSLEEGVERTFDWYSALFKL